MLALPCALLPAVLLSLATANPIETQSQAATYLSQFGYLSSDPGAANLIAEDIVTMAIKDFQAFNQLRITGVLDQQTKEYMNLPRCGVKDKMQDKMQDNSIHTRRRRYNHLGNKWGSKALTYRINSYPGNVASAEVHAEIARAFNVWSKQTDLTFTARSSGQVNIDIDFASGQHGDGDSFDGPGGTLAHAYFPGDGGDVHFDKSELWSIRSYRGINIFQVAAHEFGHSLGLGHSGVQASLMAPYYSGYDSSFSLHTDDIAGIQSLYGRPEKKVPRPEVPAEVPKADVDAGQSGLCSSSVKIDTIFTQDGDTFVFKGDNYWKLTESGTANGYPRRISRDWDGLPGNINAAFTYEPMGKTYFFKGSKHYRFTGKTLDRGYPRPISDAFFGIPDNVDAAFVWGRNGKIYFLKGSNYYKFDTDRVPPVADFYPKNFVNDWKGLPGNLDAAMKYTNGFTYFFKNGQYYRFNDRLESVDADDPPFPRRSEKWWFGCNSANTI